MQILKTIWKIVYWLVLIALIFIAGITAVSVLNIPGNYKFYTVLSGSMEPTIKTGSIVLIKPQNVYLKNDIISFKDTVNPNTTVTHRIYSINMQEGSYRTKGDANKSPDLPEIRKGMIRGKTLFSIPYLGYLIDFMKTKNGLIVIIVIAAIIIANELMSVKKESLRLIQTRKQRKLNIEEKIEEKLDEEIIKAEDEVKKVVKKGLK